MPPGFSVPQQGAAVVASCCERLWTWREEDKGPLRPQLARPPLSSAFVASTTTWSRCSNSGNSSGPAGEGLLRSPSRWLLSRQPADHLALRSAPRRSHFFRNAWTEPESHLQRLLWTARTAVNGAGRMRGTGKEEIQLPLALHVFRSRSHP